MCLAQGPQRSDAGEARIRGPSVSSQAVCDCGISWLYSLTLFVLEQTPAQAMGDLNAFYSRQIFTTRFFVVKTQKV